MFSRSIFIFIFLLICLGIGTMWIVEKEAGVDLLPNHSRFNASHKVKQFYQTSVIKLQYWWHKVTAGESSKLVSIQNEKADPDDPKIKKWQDEKGVWHFEYQKTPVAPAR